MLILETIILLLTLVLVSNVINHFIPFIPVSLIQIILGVGSTLLINVAVPLETSWFLLLFVAPLLFNDGKRFPKRELWQLRGPILGNAITLVFLTTFVGGWLIHWVVPAMPLSVSFALAAILSPTDPVAVQSITEKAALPEQVLHLVNGESLINDASGLIAFKYAIAATLTGVFSIKAATIDFLYISIVGLIVGTLLILVILLIERELNNHGINDVIFNSVLRIVSPFVVYIIAEDGFHASGVIAVVAAGIIMHLSPLSITNHHPELTLVSESTWNVIIYMLNGVVFVILGVELPLATKNVIANDNINTFGALGISFLIWLTILIVRVIWIYGYQIVISAKRSTPINYLQRFKASLIAGLSGVKGAVTMAGVLSIPVVTNQNLPFPSRSMALFIASAVIIISLIVATIMLPLIADNKEPLHTRDHFSDDDQEVIPVSEDEAKLYIMKLAIERLEEVRSADNQAEVDNLIFDYQYLIKKIQVRVADEAATQKMIDDELELREVIVKQQLQKLSEIKASGQITPQAYQIALLKTNRINNRLQKVQTVKPWVVTVINGLVYAISNFRSWLLNKKTNSELRQELKAINLQLTQEAIDWLSQNANNDQYDGQLIYNLLVHYRKQFNIISNDINSYELTYRLLREKALAKEREGVQLLLEQGKISWSIATRLRRYLNSQETVLIMDYENEI